MFLKSQHFLDSGQTRIGMTKESEMVAETTNIAVVSSDSSMVVTLPVTTVTAASAAELLEGCVKMETLDETDIGKHAAISSVRASHATLQSLLAAPISAARVITQPETIQVITLPTSSELITTSQPDGAGRVWQVVPSVGNPEFATIIAVADPSELIHATKGDIAGVESISLDIHDGTSDLAVSTADGIAAILMPPPQTPASTFPQSIPSWAARLNNCEKIGESYRGYVETEGELDLVLTYHKQQTQSFWGTRQSPSPAKPSTRLMWKSQYVPFDGIPFVNVGSRAVVMECQYGPRRKGSTNKRYHDSNHIMQYRQTCPARIYIKKVRKFPNYSVDLQQDKKSLRMAMDKAFHELRERRLDAWGQERYYVQLPTEKAHEFHDEDHRNVDKKPEFRLDVIGGDVVNNSDFIESDVRLHPKVVHKIRGLVAGGETRVYAVRKQLRAYVLREMFAGSDSIPERHDLTLFPTVNDLKNHIHQALKDIENGSLPVTASTVNVEILSGENGDGTGTEMEEGEERQTTLLGRGLGSTLPIPETVTVTLTQNPDEEGHHIISRIETHLSDGTTQVSTTLTPETAQLLSKLHPGLFPEGTLLQLWKFPVQ
ncbi:calcium-responsive transcription factor-like isoform X1 [Pomacea canaliculata]|uniref:calcium-responsive transcription factor-like isoform X1 n=2 Tax=Pomacea canaliculata TaxID=400727 RepID=UPI000D738A15|nr:calcium-responsive transcription factor-like isoform X1 [Pomacea canaliculata]